MYPLDLIVVCECMIYVTRVVVLVAMSQDIPNNLSICLEWDQDALTLATGKGS